MCKQKYIPSFNKNIEISVSGGSLSIDGGLPLIKDFMDKSKFSELFNRIVRIEESRPKVVHQIKGIVEQLILFKVLEAVFMKSNTFNEHPYKSQSYKVFC